LCAMANISSASSNTNNSSNASTTLRPVTPQQPTANPNPNFVSNQASSVRLLAGSHAGMTTNGPATNGTASPPSQQQAFYLANPHLLNAAALHCTTSNQPANPTGSALNGTANSNVSYFFTFFLTEIQFCTFLK
jgi:hypothetical protein